MKRKFLIFVCAEMKPDFVSRRIMKRFNCEYSHIGMIVDEGMKKTIYHSVLIGFSKLSYFDLMKDHYLTTIDITSRITNQDYAMGYLNGRLGVQYSILQYLGFVFPFMQRFVRNGKEKGICSEEAARFLFHCCDYKVKVDPKMFDFVSPRDVWEKLKEVLK